MSSPPDNQFAIEVRSDHGQSVVVVSGELDIATTEALGRRLRELCAGDGRRLALDLSDVTFMDSSGVHLIRDMLDVADRDGISFVLVERSSAVDQILELTGTMVPAPANGDHRRPVV